MTRHTGQSAVRRRLRMAVAIAAAAAAAACKGDVEGPPPDTAAPTVQILAPAAGFATASSTMAVSGTATDAVRVTRVTYQVNGGAETDVPVTAGTSVSFSFSVALAGTSPTLRVNAYDAAANRGGVEVAGTYDAVPPALQLTSLQASNVVIEPSVTLAGTVTDAVRVARVTYQVNGGSEVEVPITPGAAVSFSVPVSVATGANAIVVNAYDGVGNRSQAQAGVERKPAGEALVTVLDAGGAAVADAQIVAAPATGASTRPAQAAVYGNGAYTVDYLGGGTYRVRLPAGSPFLLSVARTGYLTALYYGVSVAAEAPTYLETIRFLPTTTSTGSATLSITDAFTGLPLGSASLTIRGGLNAGAGPVVATGLTGSAGTAVFSALPAGYYTAEVSRAGYSTGYLSLAVAGGSALTYRGSIAPTVSNAQIRIILDWGATPADLDSHLTGPTPSGAARFHVWWYNRTYYGPTGTLLAALDHDDVTSYGPETVTIYERSPGVYRYSVHDYSDTDLTAGSFALSQSNARVRVYQGSTLVRTFFVPTGREGTLWTVFEINGNVLTPINSMSYNTSGGLTVTDRLPVEPRVTGEFPRKPRP
jgi:uncharacterized protein YfaP (DUF2135 family)